MSVIEEQIEVEVPLRTAYDQWTQFETFPRFMGGVDRVDQLTDTTLHWVTDIAGVRREFDAQITDQVPDKRVSWRVLEGPKHDGTVQFASRDQDHTMVRLTMDYEPEGVTEKVGDATGLVRSQVRGDLTRFKEFIETRGVQTGGWRGEVGASGRVLSDESRPGGAPESRPGGPESLRAPDAPRPASEPPGQRPQGSPPGGHPAPGTPGQPMPPMW